MSRQGTLAGIVAGLQGVLEEIKAADGGKCQIVGWRGQQAHTPPSAWINLNPAGTTHDRGGKVEDRLPFELWITRNPQDTEDKELEALAALTDLALPIVDDACKQSTARDLFGIDYIARQGFSWPGAAASDTEGGALDVPALLIPITARWSGTYC